ncbi:hypothetical protein MJO29_016911 [Puccinia striiformis f. sp. tritici]|nr:hypothetical protein MJO29_016911 [Puccinia striiformis f. sp. tritici]
MLKFIPSYQPSHFYGIIQTEELEPTLSHENKGQTEVRGCKTKLMDHQIQAIHFIQRSKSELVSIPLEIWNHQDNQWVQNAFNDAVRKGRLNDKIRFDSKGCILADDMGLGKILTTLAAIQLSSREAMNFSNKPLNVENKMWSSAKLIICPLSTLENWKNKINVHFTEGSLPFKTFYGKEKLLLKFEDIARVAVVLATYESIPIPRQVESSRAASSSSQETNLNFANVEWFRIVLDEAQ